MCLRACAARGSERTLRQFKLGVAAGFDLRAGAGQLVEPQHVGAALRWLVTDEAVPIDGTLTGFDQWPLAHHLSGRAADRLNPRPGRRAAGHAVAEVSLALTTGNQLL